MSIDTELLRESIDSQWRASIHGSLSEYVKVPSLSPAFDPQWQAHGNIDAAMMTGHAVLRDRRARS